MKGLAKEPKMQKTQRDMIAYAVAIVHGYEDGLGLSFAKVRSNGTID